MGPRRRRWALASFWRAVHDVDPDARDEAGLAGAREGHTAELCEAVGLTQINPTTLTVRVRFPTLADWWEPFTLGVGPAGAYLSQLEVAQRDLVRTRCVQLMPPAPFEVAASAWCVMARV